jgi:hypothetical protein
MALAAGAALATFALLVDALPLAKLFSPALVPVADTLLGHGVLAGLLWALGAALWAARGGALWAGAAPWADAAACAGAGGSLLGCLAALAAPRAPATLGAVCWAAALGAALDADHFLAARSLRLRDALSLPARPPGHALAFVAAAVAAAAAAARAGRAPVWAPALLAAAWLPHLARDAVRRGLWIAGPVATPPVPYAAFIAALAAAPAVVAAALAAAAPASPPPPIDV